MLPSRVIEQWVGKRVQLVLVRGWEPRSAIILGHDEFGIEAEVEGDPATPRSYFPWSAVSEIKLLADQQP